MRRPRLNEAEKYTLWVLFITYILMFAVSNAQVRENHKYIIEPITKTLWKISE
jgi:hypothetical protein